MRFFFRFFFVEIQHTFPRKTPYELPGSKPTNAQQGSKPNELWDCQTTRHVFFYLSILHLKQNEIENLYEF